MRWTGRFGMGGAVVAFGVGLLGTAQPADAIGGRGDAGDRPLYVEELRADLELRRLLRKHRVRPALDEEFMQPSEELVELGNLLFYDKILSGNRDVSCATCHHALMATADGSSLSAGVGGVGLSTARSVGPGRERIPRNAPEVFNRGHADFTSMFWDSRIEADSSRPSGFLSPAGDELPIGFERAVEAQAMFPVTSHAEMRGDPGENEIADATSETEVWARLAERLLAIEEYRNLFARAFPDVPASELGFEHAARAIGAFEAHRWRSDDSPFDRFLRGSGRAMSIAEKKGAILFYGRAGCVDCHSGTWQTDLDHHAIAMPQIGPGKGHGVDGDEDLGREAVSGEAEDAFRFRTPPLRNVNLTGPYGHDGAYRTLESVVRHHMDPVASLESWDRDQVLLGPTEDAEVLFSVMDDPGKVEAIAAANELPTTRLAEKELADLLAFLGSLTDPRMLDLRGDVPRRVPSELPLSD